MRDLWNPDEPRYAEVAREMRVTGDWLVPHLNGAIYAEKPPLFFWLSALGQAAGLGFNAGRVVAGLAALGTLLVTWALARRFLGDRAALLGAVVLGTTVFFPWLARFGVLDVVLTFFVMLAAYGWIRGGPWVALFYVGIGLAVLTKGPVAIVLAVFAVLAWRISGGRGASFAAPQGRRFGGQGPWHLLWGVPLTAAIVAAWLWPACVRGGPAYADVILWKQNVGRAVGESAPHARPFWYYLQYVWLFLPWLLFLPWALPWAWRQKGFPRAMLSWAAFGFVFFSIVSGKRDRYLTPLLPPLSIVVGAWLDGAPDALARKWVRCATWLATGFLTGAAFALGGAGLASALIGLGLIKVEHAYLSSLPAMLGAIAFGIVLIAIARHGIRARRERLLPRAAACVALGMATLLCAHDLLLVPRIDQFKSPRFVAEELNRWPGEVAAYPAHFSGAYNLYSGRLTIPVLRTADEVAAHLAAAGRRLVLTSQESYERPPKGETRSLKEMLGGRYAATPIGQVGHRDMLFLTNYPPPP